MNKNILVNPFLEWSIDEHGTIIFEMIDETGIKTTIILNDSFNIFNHASCYLVANNARNVFDEKGFDATIDWIQSEMESSNIQIEENDNFENNIIKFLEGDENA